MEVWGYEANEIIFLSMTALCLLLSQMARSEDSERADRVLFNENFEDGDPKGWDLMGRGRAKVTTYAGNHSLNLSKRDQRKLWCL